MIQRLFTIYRKIPEISVGMYTVNGKTVCFARTEISQNKRNVLKGSPKFQMEYPNEKCAYHLPFETSSRPYAIFYLRHVGCVNMTAAESSVFQCARTLKVVLVIQKCDLN